MMLMNEHIFKEVGPEVSLKAGMQQLQGLERDGICYKGQKLPVVVKFHLGDSLCQHSIAGFTERFSINYFCRYSYSEAGFEKIIQPILNLNVLLMITTIVSYGQKSVRSLSRA